MAAISNGAFWSLPEAVRNANNGDARDMIDLVAKDNGGLIDDIMWTKGNYGDFGYEFQQSTYIPVPTSNRFNEGYDADRSRSTTIRQECYRRSLMQAIDANMYQTAKAAKMAFDMERARIALGFRQQLEADFFYGATGSVTQLAGLSQYYNNRSAENGQNIVCESGTAPDGTDNASIWLVMHGPDGVYGFTPQYSGAAGMQVRADATSVSDGSGKTYPAILEYYDWYYGFALRNWKNVVRIQFNAEDITKTGSTGPDLVDLIKRGLNRFPSGYSGAIKGYAAPSVIEALDRQIGNNASLGLSSQQAINSVRTERGVPIHGVMIKRCESLLTTESGVA